MKKKISGLIDFLIAIGFSLYPVVFLYSQNVSRVKLSMLLIPVLIIISLSSFIYLILKILKCINNIRLLVPVVIYLLFFYNLIHLTIVENGRDLSFLGKNRYLIIILIIILVTLFYQIGFSKSKQVKVIATTFLTVILFLPIIDIILSCCISKSNDNLAIKTVFRDIKQSNDQPNVYYIILDGYTSDKNLDAFCKFDNKAFSDTLKKMGFYIQDNACSNYDKTLFSLASTLNLDYINQIEKGKLQEENTELYLANNKVSEILKANGYNYYLFDLGYALKIKYSAKDILIKTLSNSIQDDMISSPDNDFFIHFLDNSIFALLPNNYSDFTNKGFANKIRNVFKSLPSVASLSGKKFVFAHIISPHPPFLFDLNGNYNYKTSSKANLWNKNDYIEQLRYINKEALKAIGGIIKNDTSSNKIIIIQGDHGTRTIETNNNYHNKETWVKERYGIFNAIYINKNDSIKKRTLDTWRYSSVNTFRIILNNYFQMKLPIIADNKYYADISKQPYTFYRIED